MAMISRLKKAYLLLLLSLFFNKKRYGQQPSAVGRALIPLLPKPRITWRNGISLRPNYMNRRWLVRSMRGQHEPSLELFMQKILREGDIYIDVGAQVGLTVAMGALEVGASGKVVALEPDPYNYRILMETLHLNRLENVRTFNMAAGAEPGEALFSNETWSGLTQVRSESDATRRVQVVTVDDVARQENLERLRMLKIDVDGPDFLVLLGAVDLLQQYRPAIAVECSRFWARFGHTFADAWEFLRDRGYVVAVGDRNAETFRTISSPSELPQGWGSEKGLAINIYCLHPEEHADLLGALGL